METDGTNAKRAEGCKSITWQVPGEVGRGMRREVVNRDCRGE